MAPCIQTVAAPSPLIQIRGGYRASWSDLSLSVESGPEGWTANVGRLGRSLYTAQRSSARAAKNAAVEFALLGAGATWNDSPERVAGQLRWSEYW